MPSRVTTRNRSAKTEGHAGRLLGPILGGSFTALLVSLTVLMAVVLGSQEQLLVSGRPPAGATDMASPAPSPARPTPTLVAVVVPTPLAPTVTATAVTPIESSTATPTVSIPTFTATRCPQPAGWVVYTVKKGETLHTLAVRRGTSDSALMQANCLQTVALSGGQKLYVPPLAAPTRCYRPAGWMDYVVRHGDTLSALAAYFGSSVYELKRVNCLRSDLIMAGAVLWVPYRPTATRPVRTPTRTRTPTQTSTPTPSPTGGTETPTEIVTPIPTGDTPVPTDTDTPIPEPSDTPIPEPSDTPIPEPSDTPIPEPSNTPIPEPSNTPGSIPRPVVGLTAAGAGYPRPVHEAGWTTHATGMPTVIMRLHRTVEYLLTLLSR